ncbi:hypothetical protein H9L15_00430 [Sphingomonas daechungensis]|uniref:Uncharacterized protein n=1 Tax=Sphingomonas daechungensis TaxID=1176646 RepID=A0ABX6T765_9SPHN|nr:hypothetical protein [Sphingomonas daechungensis]QNP44543.1 hypothetical protein H9L15_00430 [Sphingomonas daechungensis]
MGVEPDPVVVNESCNSTAFTRADRGQSSPIPVSPTRSRAANGAIASVRASSSPSSSSRAWTSTGIRWPSGASVKPGCGSSKKVRLESVSARTCGSPSA